MDMFSITQNVFSPVLSFIWSLFSITLITAISVILLFLLVFFLRYPFWKSKDKAAFLKACSIKFFPYDLLRWLLHDILTLKSRKAVFSPYGFTIFVGRQGSGKTISMVRYLDQMKKRYPKCLIVTNFSYAKADFRMTDWRDLFDIRNGTDGVIFAIDEIHSEYSSASWKDFPETLLSEISQQRKQRIKIVASSQVFSRVAKPMRDQAVSVVCCNTYFGRLTTSKEYDAAEYSTTETPYQVRKSLKPLRKQAFVQSDDLRQSYDTWEKVERLKRTEFIPRHERG